MEGGISADWREQAEHGQIFINDQVTVPAVETVPEEEKTFSVLLSAQEQPTRRVELLKRLTAPVRPGDLVGHVTYSLGDLMIKTYPLYAGEAAERRGLHHYLYQACALFLLPES